MKAWLSLFMLTSISLNSSVLYASGIACGQLLSSTKDSISEPYKKRTHEEYLKEFGIPPERGVNLAEYRAQFGVQQEQLHQKFMREASENILGIALIVRPLYESSEIFERWAPYLRELVISKKYLTEQGILEVLKKWDLEIATAVERSVLKEGFDLYFYRDLSPAEIQSKNKGRIGTAIDDYVYDKKNPKHAFLWFRGLPKRWASVLNYSALIHGRFGHTLYQVKLGNHIVKNSTYTLGDEFETGPRKNISDVFDRGDKLHASNYTRKTMFLLYDMLGLKLMIPPDGEHFGTFPLGDRRGLLLYLFLEMEEYSRYAGVESGLKKSGKVYMPFDSWIDVSITTELKLGRNVMAMPEDQYIPKGAKTEKW